MSSEQVDPIFAPLHNQLLKKWKNYRPIIAAEVPTWASASSFAFTCEGESLDFRGSMEWLRDKSKSSGKKTRLKAPLYWLNVADYFHKIKDLTGFPPLLVRKALFYDNFPEEPPSKESHNTRALKNWIELGEIMQFLLSKNLGFLLCAAVLSQAE
jgi:hypothetical protein